ncbi:hypothetical protein GCM10020254_02020 [Streptomyces goshikiensis]
MPAQPHHQGVGRARLVLDDEDPQGRFGRGGGPLHPRRREVARLGKQGALGADLLRAGFEDIRGLPIHLLLLRRSRAIGLLNARAE